MGLGQIVTLFTAKPDAGPLNSRAQGQFSFA
jgi:hypothetical protein